MERFQVTSAVRSMMFAEKLRFSVKRKEADANASVMHAFHFLLELRGQLSGQFNVKSGMRPRVVFLLIQFSTGVWKMFSWHCNLHLAVRKHVWLHIPLYSSLQGLHCGVCWISKG